MSNLTKRAQHFSALQGAVLFALRFYKMYLSVLMGGTCRFEPTCSQYAHEAVERFGALRGCWLALKRLLRCQPFARRFGYDPVPESEPSDDVSIFPQGLEHNENSPAMPELELRPTNLINAETGYAPEHHEARS